MQRLQWGSGVLCFYYCSSPPRGLEASAPVLADPLSFHVHGKAFESSLLAQHGFSAQIRRLWASAGEGEGVLMGRIWRSRWVSLTGSGPTLPSVAGRPETDVRRAGIGRRPPCFTEREQDLGARQAESISSHHVSFRAAGPCGGEKGEEGRSQAPWVQDAQGGRSHPHRHSPPTRGVPALHTAVSDSCKRDSVGSGTGVGQPGLGMHSMGGVWGA